MKPIYLEPDEEITSIIDRLSKISESKIAVVVPKNSTMFQSLVNLKLLARQAQKLNKTIVIISGNKVGSRLARQVGIDTYASLGIVTDSSTPTLAPTVVTPRAESPVSDVLPDGTPIHRYSPDLGTRNSELVEKEPVDIESVANSNQNTNEETVDEVEEKTTPHIQSPVAPIDQPVSSPESPVSPPADGLPPIVSRGIISTPELNFVFPWKSALVATAMVLIAVLITFFFLPKATITLTFPAKLLSETFILSAKTDATANELVITGNLLTVDKTGTKVVTATGKKDIGTKSSGNLAIKNCEDTNAHSLVAGTKTTASGKIFTTDTSVIIPAGTFSGGGTVCTSSSVAVSITASQAGEAHNLTSATFTFANLPSRISGTGSTTGGTTKQITVFSSADAEGAYAELKTQLTKDATSELKDKAGNQTILDEAIKQIVVEQKIDKEVGAQTDNATVSVNLELFTIAFDQSAVEIVAKNILTTKLEANQQLIIPNDRKPALTFKELTDDKTTLQLDVRASGFAARSIDKSAIAKSVKNKSIEKAKVMLQNQYQAEEIKIEIIPGWWIKRLPIMPQAIGVEYGFNELPAQ